MAVTGALQFQRKPRPVGEQQLQIAINQQILIYPMLDELNIESDPTSLRLRRGAPPDARHGFDLLATGSDQRARTQGFRRRVILALLQASPAG